MPPQVLCYPQDPQGPSEDVTYCLRHWVHHIFIGYIFDRLVETVGGEDGKTHTEFQNIGGETL